MMKLIIPVELLEDSETLRLLRELGCYSAEEIQEAVGSAA